MHFPLSFSETLFPAAVDFHARGLRSVGDPGGGSVSRSDSPLVFNSIRWLWCTMRSRIASARVGSPETVRVIVSVAVMMFTMPARQRKHYSASPPKVFTITLEPCSRSAGINVHVTLETLFTISRNMHHPNFLD